MPARMTCKEFLAIYSLLKREDKLDESTYVKASQKARFIDPIYGEYWCKPSHILFGLQIGHPKRRWERAVATRRKKYGTGRVGGRRKA